MAPVDETPDAAYRLPRSVSPERYVLAITPDLAEATFSGTAAIDLVISEPTDAIVCNAADLAIFDAVIEPSDGTIHALDVSFDAARERVSFTTPEPIPTGRVTLRCGFTGVLNDKLRGFYRSTYTDQNGESRTIATTQMESTDARRAFPCWDEPDRKAVFEITLVVEEGLAAFSNSSEVEVLTLAAESAESEARRAVRFAPTMPMSTYLVAFVVGPMEVTAPVHVDGVPIRVVHVPGKEHLTPYALEVAQHSLRFFAEYFDIAYPSDKLDLVAIPDFAFGAMENLGCVTFRETALLVDPENSSRSELERVADVISHEIAHMWFGDLVTMKWWEGIWLNEAFATFMEVLCVDAFRPEWQRWVSFGLEREAALAVDGLHATRPIEYPVGSPEEADGMFDVLTYQKGGSVLRMLEQYLGADVFRTGVRRYLRTHAYSNTVTADLWNALEEASGEPVREVMDSWILQGGHPLVRVRDGILSQEPFTYSLPGSPPGSDAVSAIGRAWRIPVMLGSGSDLRRLLLDPGEDTDTGSSPDTDLLVNAGGWGVYRVGYEPRDAARLAARLATLSPLERCNLLADTWALVLSGRDEPDRFFNLASALAEGGSTLDGDDPSAWSIVVGALGLCDRVLPEADRPTLQTAVQTLCGPRAASLGFDAHAGEGERVPSLRALLLSALGGVGNDRKVREEALRRFDESSSGLAIPADIEGAVLQSVAAQLRPGDFEAILERYRHPTTPQEELRYLTALAAFPDIDLSLRTFALACSEVRTQNAPYLIATLLGNRMAGPSVWAEVERTWTSLLEQFPVNSHSRMLDGVRGLCGDPEIAERVEGFLGEHTLRSGERSVRQSIERLRINVAFGTRTRDALPRALGAVAASAGTPTSLPT